MGDFFQCVTTQHWDRAVIDLKRVVKRHFIIGRPRSLAMTPPAIVQ